MGLSTTKFERVEFETMGDALRLRDKYQIIFNTRQKIMSNTRISLVTPRCLEEMG